MESTFEHMDGLVAKMLSGEATQSEIDEVNAWAALSQENKSFVEDAFKLLNQLEVQPSSHHLDVDQAWEKLNNRISKPAKVIQWPINQTMWRAVAAILLLVGLVIIIQWAFSGEVVQTESVLAQYEPVTKTLSDGTIVKVEKGSEIRFEKNKNGQRRVSLKGKAEFEVVHDQSHPFIVETEGVLVEDIGTRFKVSTMKENETVDVVVLNGEVRFYLPGENGLDLSAGESARYYKNTKRFEKLQTNAKSQPAEMTSRILEFNETSLQEVVTRISAMYNCQVTLANKNMASCKLTVVFTDESLDTILNVIAETLEIKIENKDNEIILTGKGCVE